MKDHYIVSPVDTFWIVISSNGHRVAYDDRNQAIHAAVKAAHASGERGNQAQVLVLGPGNDLYPIWIHGRDSFSPSRMGIAQTGLP